MVDNEIEDFWQETEHDIAVSTRVGVERPYSPPRSTQIHFISNRSPRLISPSLQSTGHQPEVIGMSWSIFIAALVASRFLPWLHSLFTELCWAGEQELMRTGRHLGAYDFVSSYYAHQLNDTQGICIPSVRIDAADTQRRDVPENGPRVIVTSIAHCNARPTAWFYS